MRELLIPILHLLTGVARRLGPGGAKALVAENLLIRQQLIVLTRSRRRAPNLMPHDRILLGFWSLLMRPVRLRRAAIVIQPATLLSFHHALIRRKYQLLLSPKKRGKPGPKGPSPDLVRTIVELKRRNPRFGCPRIASTISRTFGLEIDKDVVRRVLAKHYHPSPGGRGPSWLTFIGLAKDSLWSVDLFRCESVMLRTHWVLVVMDQFTRRIIGIGVHTGAVDGMALCRMVNHAIVGQGVPRYLSSDNDPLFEYHRWRANLRILDIEEIKTVPEVPWSHPFVERLIGTIRRECLDQTMFWNSVDLESKRLAFLVYYNQERTPSAVAGATPDDVGGRRPAKQADLGRYRWQTHCRGLYQLPMAA